MKEKIKSLLFLLCFIICAVVYFQIDKDCNVDDNTQNEKSRFVTLEVEDNLENEDYNDIPDIIIDDDSIE
jgi:hypothetical protein